MAETHFASLTDYGSRYEIELVELAKKFFEKKLSESSTGKISHIKALAMQVDSYVANREEIEKAYTEDRVADAFRSIYAKAAKVAVDKGDFVEADDNFQLAILEDPTNAALHDRYAFFLLNKLKDSKRALEMSKLSVSLNPANCDANVTMAFIYYRLGNLPEGDNWLDKSQRLGRPDDFCFLRKGVARYHQAFKLNDNESAIEQLNLAQLLLNKARKASSTDTGYGIKNLNEIVKYQDLVLKRIYNLRK